MKNTFLTALLALTFLPFTAMTAEIEKPGSSQGYKVVFEVTSDGAEKWQGALRNVANARKSLGEKMAKFVVVAHGKGLGMLLAKNVTEIPEMKIMMEKLHEEGVVFEACENTMRREKLEKKDLVESAVTVDSGVAEVIRRQSEGFSYIKIGG